jgi:hypothetical protein
MLTIHTYTKTRADIFFPPQKKTTCITKMKDSINMGSTIAGSINAG